MSLPVGQQRRLSVSPPPRRGRRTGREPFDERVIERSSASIVYPTLTRTNYTEWSMVMRVNLQAQGLWESIDPGTDDFRADHTALAAILRVVSQDMLTSLAQKGTAREAWEAIRTVRVGVEHVKEANAEKLRQDFATITFKEGERVEDFSLRVTGLANELRVLGDPITDKEVVKKMLRVAPEYLEQVAISIETLLDLDVVSIEEATGRLRAVEERKRPALGRRLHSQTRRELDPGADFTRRSLGRSQATLARAALKSIWPVS